MANYIHLTGDNIPIPIPPYTMIYKKPTNSVGGWSYAARPEAEDSKFYELKGEWFYVVKDRAELLSLRNQGTWMTSTDPNQLVSITDKDGVIKSIPMNNLVTTRVSDMELMLSGSISNQSHFNQYIGNWDTSNVVNMKNIFFNSVRFNQPIGNWDTGNVVNMGYVFSYSYDFNQPIGNWNTGNVVNMAGMFLRSSSFNQPIGNWDTGNVVNMGEMFAMGAPTSFNQDISSWNVSNVTDMYYMFRNCSSFNQDLSSWCVSSVTNHNNFDLDTPAWTLPKPNFTNPPC